MNETLATHLYMYTQTHTDTHIHPPEYLYVYNNESLVVTCVI